MNIFPVMVNNTRETIKKESIMNNNLTEKEKTLLKDLKSQEKLCVEKYRRYSCAASCSELSGLFTAIGDVEEGHYRALCDMSGEACEPINVQNTCADGAKSAENDAFLCSDMLATEKHVSALYDTCVFEFTSNDNRRRLNNIQSDEQQHGEKLYSYMKAHNMYG